MISKEKAIENIDWQVWYRNDYHDGTLPSSKLHEDPDGTAELVKAYCNIIVKNPKNEVKIKDAIAKIEELVAPGGVVTEDRLDNSGKTRLRDMSEWIAGIIIENCDVILARSSSEKSLDKANSLFKNKIFYFEGYESGSEAIYIKNIHFNNEADDILFDGGLVEFTTENTVHDGDGVIIKDVEDYPFSMLPYSQDEYEDEEELIDFLQNSESLTPKKLKEDIVKAIVNCLEYSETFGNLDFNS